MGMRYFPFPIRLAVTGDFTPTHIKGVAIGMDGINVIHARAKGYPFGCFDLNCYYLNISTVSAI